MNINIYLEDSLAAQLNQYAKYYGKPRNAILREAVKEWVAHQQTQSWPQSILHFKGCPDFPGVETDRNYLSDPAEDPFL